MKSFKKSLQESRLKTHQLIRSWLRPKLGAVGTKCRLPGRIRLANAWARKHPKRTFACVVGSLSLLLVGGIASDFLTGRNVTEPDVSAIANMEPLFSGFRTIQANKDAHRCTLLELTAEGQAVRRELDSLIAVPKKSRADSVRIVRHYKKLENIVKSLKNNDNP